MALDLTFLRRTRGNAGRNVKSATLGGSAPDVARQSGELTAGRHRQTCDWLARHQCPNPSPRRRSLRLPAYDYSRAGAYFITVCTHSRIMLFGEVIGDDMRLNDSLVLKLNSMKGIVL